MKPLPWLKFTAGGRYDQFYYDIDDRITPGGTPNISSGIASPKAGVAITPVKWLELFANYGEGFRSIDVPAELIGNPGIQPFRIVSREGGFQTTFDRFKFLASYWNTESADEAFQPAAGLPVHVPGQSTTRWLRYRRPVFCDQGSYRQRVAVRELRRGAGAADRCSTILFRANVPNYVANIGIDFNVATVNAQTLSGSAYVTFVGKKNLTQDGLITASPYSRVTGKLAYSWPDGLDRLYTGDLVSRRQPE